MKRTSKTFVESEAFTNRLATGEFGGQKYIMNPWIESKEEPDFGDIDDSYLPNTKDLTASMLVSQKIIPMKEGK